MQLRAPMYHYSSAKAGSGLNAEDPTKNLKVLEIIEAFIIRSYRCIDPAFTMVIQLEDTSTYLLQYANCYSWCTNLRNWDTKNIPRANCTYRASITFALSSGNNISYTWQLDDETSFFPAKSKKSMHFLLISQALWFFFGKSHIPFWQEDHRFTIHLAATATQNYYNSSGVVSRGGNSPGRFLAQATNRTTTCIYLSHFGWNLRYWYCHIGFNFPVILGLCGVLWLLIGVRNNSMYPSCLEKYYSPDLASECVSLYIV